MDKSKITPEVVTKLLREHAELFTLLQMAPEPENLGEYKEWWAKRKEVLGKIKKLES